MRKLLCTCVLILCPMIAWAQDTAEDAVFDLSDPVFETFVDIDLLRSAWSSYNASLLTDVAILFQKAEKELFRSHRVFTSQQLLVKALVLAADVEDTATLERLERIAKANGNNAFATKVAMTAKLAAESRSIEPSIDLSAKATPESLHYYSTFADLIKRSRLTGDVQTLEKLEKNLKSVPEVREKMDPAQVESLVKLSAESRAAIGDVSEEDLSVGLALEKLVDDSRQYGGRYGYGGPGMGPRLPIGPPPGMGPRPPIGPPPGMGPRPPMGPYRPMTDGERLGRDIGRLIDTLIRM